MLIGGRQQLFVEEEVQYCIAQQELRIRGRTPPTYDWTPPEGVDRRVHLRSLLPTVEVDGKQYLEGGRLGAVQEDAAAAAATVAASSSAGEGEPSCNIM